MKLILFVAYFFYLHQYVLVVGLMHYVEAALTRVCGVGKEPRPTYNTEGYGNTAYLEGLGYRR